MKNRMWNQCLPPRRLYGVACHTSKMLNYPLGKEEGNHDIKSKLVTIGALGRLHYQLSRLHITKSLVETNNAKVILGLIIC
jgi:hypothetical protein